MKKKIDKTILEFCSTVLSVGEKLTPESLLYWARNSEELQKLLQKENFEPITQIVTKPLLIPALPEKTSKLLQNKRLLDRNDPNTLEYHRTLEGVQPATEPAYAFSYRLNVKLYLEEFLEEIGGIDLLRNSAFTYAQIVWLVSRHNKERITKGAIMDYRVYNYFPLLQDNGKVEFVRFRSRRPYGGHTSWVGCFRREFEKEGVLLIKEVGDLQMRS